MAKLSCATFAALLVASATAARAEPCAQTASHQPFATGSGKADPRADSAGLRRLGAERAAFLDALVRLRACLGPRASTVTGWSVAAVRYFDSDPIVEVDVAASFDKAPQLTVLGSALPDVARESLRGGNVKRARLETTRAAVTMAQRNATEALDVLFPSTGEKGGDVKQTLAGSLGGCATSDIAYWGDQAVSVRLTCGQAIKPAPVEPHRAPRLEKHQ